jgi:hypothetical protein
MKYLLIITALLFSMPSGNNYKRTLQLILAADELALDQNNNLYVVEGSKVSIYHPYGDFITQSEKVSQETDKPINASYMTCDRNNLYLADPEQGIFVFDPIGQHQETIPVKGFQDLRIEDKTLYYTTGSEAKILDLTTDKEQDISMPVSKFNAASIHKKGNNSVVCVAHRNTVEVYEQPGNKR